MNTPITSRADLADKLEKAAHGSCVTEEGKRCALEAARIIRASEGGTPDPVAWTSARALKESETGTGYVPAWAWKTEEFNVPLYRGAQSATAHAIAPDEIDTHLLAAWTAIHYSGDYPPLLNFTMVRMKGDVVLTVRLPTVHSAPPGDCASVRFTRDMWAEFVKQVEVANKVFNACDFLDSQ